MKEQQYHQASSLLNEKGNISIYRVSEETRKKVAEETRQIEIRRVQTNLQSRRKFREDENAKFREREKFRNAMMDRWLQKTSKSPYGIDRWKEEENRQTVVKERELRRKINEDKIRTVASMTGHSDNIFGKVALNNVHNPQTKLALNFKQSLMDEKIISKEQKILDQMLLDQLSLLVDRFPSIVSDDLASSIKSSNGSLQDEKEDDSRSKESQSDHSRSTIASNNPYIQQLKKMQQNPLEQQSKVTGTEGSISTGFSGPLDYTSPDERMRDLADDMSDRFKL